MGFAEKILGASNTQPKVNLATPPQAGPGSGYQANTASDITAQPQNQYVPGPCNENSQSNANQLPTVTIVVPGVVNVYNAFDILVTMPRATKKVKICSFAQDQSSDYRYFAMSLLKTGLGPNNAEYTVTGTEPWIPLPANETFLAGTEIEFEYPVQQFYFHIMQGTGNQTSKITFMCADGLRVTIPPAATQIGS